jgi:hypothetical protein
MDKNNFQFPSQVPICPECIGNGPGLRFRMHPWAMDTTGKNWKVQIPRELGICESGTSRLLALLGATNHEAPYPSGGAKAWHQQANWLATTWAKKIAHES